MSPGDNRVSSDVQEPAYAPYITARCRTDAGSYRLLEALGRGGFGEVWKCEAPGGLVKAIKFVWGSEDGPDTESGSESGADVELRAVQHVLTIRHPFLLSMDRIERVGRDLVIVEELADQSLHDRYRECVAAGMPDPADGPVESLSEAAEAARLAEREHGLQHLDVKPHNLLLVRLHVKVADFGLVQQSADRASTDNAVGPVSLVYASPEIFAGKLWWWHRPVFFPAVSYCEMLPEHPPFDGKNVRQWLAMQHTCAEKPRSRPPAGTDRETVARDWRRSRASGGRLARSLCGP